MTYLIKDNDKIIFKDKFILKYLYLCTKAYMYRVFNTYNPVCIS